MSLRRKIEHVIFDHDTKAARLFDIILIYVIALSVISVLLESIPALGVQLGDFFYALEWGFTIIFTIEYIFRIWSSSKPMSYIKSKWGIIDLLAILPTYLSIFLVGYHYLLIIRILRLMRVFRIFRLTQFIDESQFLLTSLRASVYKIGVFMGFVMMIVIILGTVMYVIEAGQEGFTSIPQSIYWAIVTISTVGYGDMIPTTPLGKIISSFAMLLGYALIAVPMGIVSAEISKKNKTRSVTICGNCQTENIAGVNYCYNCGNKLT